MKQQLLVRADADSQSGIGHVMRSLALSQQWQVSGGTAIFLSHCESEQLRRRVETSGIKLVALDTPHLDVADLQSTLDLLREVRGKADTGEAPWLVLDGYHFDSDYQRAIRTEGYRLLVIDDLAHLDSYHAHLILNQNVTATDLHYRCEADTTLLLGTKYALLRPEFTRWREWQRQIPQVARKVLVTLGGGDSDNITLKVIEAFDHLRLPEVEVRVVVGVANPHHHELLRRVSLSSSRMQLIYDSSEMPQLMEWADMAISAAGTTSLELAFMGLPSLLIVLADNQRMIAEKWDKMGVTVSLGDGLTLYSKMLGEEIAALMLDSKRRAEMSRLGRRLVDGKGAGRVISVMLKNGSKLRGGSGTVEIRIRAAALDDARILWEWANDPAARANSFNQDPIAWEAHLRWYNERFGRSDTRFWILEADGVAVGHIRYDVNRKDKSAQISFSVARGHRGKGYGIELIKRTCGMACAELGVDKIKAVAFTSNQASSRAFLRAGFKSSSPKILNGHECYEFCWQPVNEAESQRK